MVLSKHWGRAGQVQKTAPVSMPGNQVVCQTNNLRHLKCEVWFVSVSEWLFVELWNYLVVKKRSDIVRKRLLHIISKNTNRGENIYILKNILKVLYMFWYCRKTTLNLWVQVCEHKVWNSSSLKLQRHCQGTSCWSASHRNSGDSGLDKEVIHSGIIVRVS